MDIMRELFALKDEKYREFQSSLIPSVPVDFIGVRTPDLRKLAGEIVRTGEAGDFLSELPHRYFEENQLHAFILSSIKDFDLCIRGVEAFLPFVNNWATCDQMSPVVFSKHRRDLLPHIKEWISSTRTYTVRFSILMLMKHFLDDDFDPVYPKMVSEIKSGEYYVKMMVSWYFATALARQYSPVIGYLEEGKLDRWVHLKTIQKAVESYRIPEEKKAYLKTLRSLDKLVSEN